VFERIIFEGLIHLEEEFAHESGEGDFGWFAGLTEALIKLSENRGGLATDSDSAHVEGAADDSTAAANMSLAFPRSALAGPGGQSGQRGCCLAIELAQFRHLAQYADGGQGADAIQLSQLLNLFLATGRAGQNLSQFFFHGGDLLIQMCDQFFLLAKGKAQKGMLGMLASPNPMLFKLIAPLDQSAEFSQGRLRYGRGRRLKGTAISGQYGRIQRIIFSPATFRQGEVANSGWIDDGDRNTGCLKCCHHGAFVTAGRFTDDVSAGHCAQKLDQSRVAFRRIGKSLLAILEVELEAGLGNIQTSVDGREFFSHDGWSVRAHSCTCEHVVFAAALSTVRVTDIRHERLRLPDEHVQTVPEGNEHTRAAVLPPAGGRTAPSSRLAFSQARKMKKNIQEGRLRVSVNTQPFVAGL
jgi:hypothetical protein